MILTGIGYMDTHAVEYLWVETRLVPGTGVVRCKSFSIPKTAAELNTKLAGIRSIADAGAVCNMKRPQYAKRDHC